MFRLLNETVNETVFYFAQKNETFNETVFFILLRVFQCKIHEISCFVPFRDKRNG
jgi:hypothetical protein